jgi:hypothetical protein
VNVEIDTPAGIAQFTGAKIVNDFYFIGKATPPTTTFDVKYKVTLTKAASDAGCVLVAPVPAADTKKTAGGLVVSYAVERKVKGEMKIKGDIYFLPVEIKVNETAKQEDDFVAVSKGTDEDLATDFSVKLTGTDGVTAELSVKAGDGDIKFKNTELALESGKEVKTKLWGITPSSAKDTTIIEITLKKDYKELGKLEEYVTVFKWVRVYFDGAFIANVNSVPEGWRPIPPADTQAQKQDVQDYNSQIKFHPDDQNKLLRAWASAPSVNVATVEMLQPHIVIGANIDEIVNSELSLKKGYFQAAASDPRTNEHIYELSIDIRKDKTKIFINGTITYADSNVHKKHPKGDLPFLKGWENQKNINASIDLAKAPKEISDYYKDKWLTVRSFLTFRQQWKNEKITFIKQAGGIKSIVVKGLLGAQEIKSDPKSSIMFDLQRFNIWYLGGEIANGILTTEKLP